MREIKFRARNANVPRCWIYGYFVIENGHNFIINEDGKFPVIADTESQYTGRKDCNDKEIYEGDVVLTTEPPGNGLPEIKHEPVIVTWNNDYAGFELGYISNGIPVYNDYEVIDDIGNM